ncbi:MAG TPA: fenitrothion hydrolase [Solirubrobacterales bacterium]|nr:fenitrothion hydrolase [Solirubrobacterales bacterium]
MSAPVMFGHALVARGDLPLPEWLFAWAAAMVLLVSFFALAVTWRTSRFEADSWRPLRGGLASRLGALALSRPVAAFCGTLGVALLALTIYAGLAGTSAPDRNFTITFVFVTAWLGFPVLGIVLGDLFAAFNPWRAIGRLTGAAFRLIAGQAPAHLPYPTRLGRWPAALGVAAFVWLEVIHGSTGGVSVGLDPGTVGLAALVYSAYTLSMMALFGTETWVRNGESFGVYFNMFSQLGIFESRDGRLGRRKPFAAATRWASVPGSVAVVLASIATTTFDGAQEGVLEGAIASVYESLLDAGALSATWSLRLADTLFMLSAFALVIAVYTVGVWGMRSVRGAPGFKPLASAFAHSLIPIAFAYLLAHYFSLIVYQGQAQFTYLLSDPLGAGTTDLFGTASSGIDYGVLGANLIWYVQVGTLVAGHVLGLVYAHDRAVAIWSDRRDAARSQYWMLGVMIAFTCLGLYLLSVANA